MTDLIIQPKFETLTTQLNSKGEECYDEHTIAEALGIPFFNLERVTDKLEKANDIHGDSIRVTVKAGFTTKEVESRLFNLDDTKLIVTQSGGKHAVAFCRYLIQRDKKATSFDTLLNNPDNAVKVFQELANQKRKAQELEARLPLLEAERDQAIAQRHLIDDKRTASAMGTAGALKKKNQALSLENQALKNNLSQQNPNQAISFEAYRILTGVQEMSPRHKGLMFKRLADAGWVPELKFIGSEPYPTKCFPIAAFDSFFNKLESFFGGL